MVLFVVVVDVFDIGINSVWWFIVIWIGLWVCVFFIVCIECIGVFVIVFGCVGISCISGCVGIDWVGIVVIVGIGEVVCFGFWIVCVGGVNIVVYIGFGCVVISVCVGDIFIFCI